MLGSTQQVAGISEDNPTPVEQLVDGRRESAGQYYALFLSARFMALKDNTGVPI